MASGKTTLNTTVMNCPLKTQEELHVQNMSSLKQGTPILNRSTGQVQNTQKVQSLHETIDISRRAFDHMLASPLLVGYWERTKQHQDTATERYHWLAVGGAVAASCASCRRVAIPKQHRWYGKHWPFASKEGNGADCVTDQQTWLRVLWRRRKD